MITTKPTDTPEEIELHLHFSSFTLKSMVLKQGKQLLLEVDTDRMLHLLGRKLDHLYLQDVSEVIIKIGEHLVRAEVQTKTQTVFAGLELKE